MIQRVTVFSTKVKNNINLGHIKFLNFKSDIYPTHIQQNTSYLCANQNH